MKIIIDIILFSLILKVCATSSNYSVSCGYDSCPKLDPANLNVHIVAHSHDDVGWLKTIDQYYYGSKNFIQLAGVQYILDSVIQSLLQNPERRFIYVETAFLYQWWQEQNLKRQQEVQKLIHNGQLQIAGGAWSMNDEATAHYQSIIDQFTFGLKFLEDTFGECARPKVAWQIDAFGHTREMASIFSQIGFDALFFARLDWRDKIARLTTKTGELLWQVSANLKNTPLLFTHIMFSHYSPPQGFYFDLFSRDPPLISDEQSSEYNLQKKIHDFTKYVNRHASYYSSNNIMVAMGNDFAYQDALFSFKNLDILINAYKNSDQKDSKGRRIKLLYSTPNCYVKSVNNEANSKQIRYKIKTDDFIPYASDLHTYWTGYYTSRPTHKRFERLGNNLLQIVKQLTVLSGVKTSAYEKDLHELKAAMGIMQHHDAITGTAKQHVANDYAKIVTKAFKKTFINLNKFILRLITKPGQYVNLNFESCLLTNVSHCTPSQSRNFVVAIYNPLSRRVNYHVRIPVNSTEFSVVDFQGCINVP